MPKASEKTEVNGSNNVDNDLAPLQVQDTGEVTFAVVSTINNTVLKYFRRQSGENTSEFKERCETELLEDKTYSGLASKDLIRIEKRIKESAIAKPKPYCVLSVNGEEVSRMYGKSDQYIDRLERNAQKLSLGGFDCEIFKSHPEGQAGELHASAINGKLTRVSDKK